MFSSGDEEHNHHHNVLCDEDADYSQDSDECCFSSNVNDKGYSTDDDTSSAYADMVSKRRELLRKQKLPNHIIMLLQKLEDGSSMPSNYISDLLRVFIDTNTNNQFLSFTWYHIWTDSVGRNHCVSYIGITLQHIASLYGCTNLISSILVNPTISSRPKDPYGRTPLHISSMVGHLNVVRLLTEHNINSIYDTTISCATALHKSVDNGHLDITVLLIKLGANINSTCEVLEYIHEYEFPIMYNKNIAQLLNDPMYNQKSLPYANWKGRNHVTKYILNLFDRA